MVGTKSPNSVDPTYLRKVRITSGGGGALIFSYM